MDPSYPLFPIFAFLGFILSLIPLPWHLQAWNSGTCFYMMWAALACLNQFVNSIVWHGNSLNPAPIWCDISIRIMMGASVGLPAASLCINRRLYMIANVRSVSISRGEKMRSILVDALICVLFPIIYIAMQYVVQGHRFNILEDIGCYPALYNTVLTYFISGMWPIVIGLISLVYCVLSLRSFALRRVEFSQFLSSNKSLTVSRYFRLMALAMTEMLLTTPLAIFMIWLNATATPVGPWRNWEDTHFAFSRIEQIPAIFWRSSHLLSISFEFSRWVTPMCAIVFFAFFGFADEAQKHYRLAFWWILKPFGIRPQPAQRSGKIPSIGQFQPQAYTASSAAPTLPAYSPPASSVFIDVKRPASITSSLTETIDDSSTQFSSPNPRNTRQSFPIILMTENPHNTLTGSPHDYYDLESQYSPSLVPSTPRPYSAIETHNVGVAT